jgi:CheY-like chemotaxis protein
MSHSRILIVEDEMLARESFKMLLELEGFSVAAASNGRDALQMIEDLGQPCLILLDLMMPVMNGWEFLDTVQKGHAPGAAGAPIVVISAAADALDDPLLRAYPVIRKPFHIEDLLAQVRQHCRTACVEHHRSEH